MPTCIQTCAHTVKNDAQAVSNTVVLVVCEQLDSVRLRPYLCTDGAKAPGFERRIRRMASPALFKWREDASHNFAGRAAVQDVTKPVALRFRYLSGRRLADPTGRS